jgi:FkbM family methyltransferase
MIARLKRLYRCALTGGSEINWSYSQEGEDVLIDRFLGKPARGFYVDIGAHHPRRFSNTYRFYLRGWYGINVDAMPGSMQPFRKLRPRDINLEVGVAEQPGTLTYYMFDEPALNGFSADLAEQRLAQAPAGRSPYRLIGTKSIQCTPLNELLDRYADGIQIDFLTIDVEGLDLDVLRSNDWQKHRPTLVLAECIDVRDALIKVHDSPTTTFMSECGYRAVAKTFNTVFFRDVPASHASR